jgi:hypothetical protein
LTRDEGRGFGEGPPSPGYQTKPPSVAEARCCPLVIIPRRLSYHTAGGPLPPRSAWSRKPSWFWFWISSFLPFPLSLPLERRRLDKTSPALCRQPSLPGRIACTALARPPPACPPQSLSSCRFAPGQPTALHTHTHTNRRQTPIPPDEESQLLPVVNLAAVSWAYLQPVCPPSFGQQGLFLCLSLSRLSSSYFYFYFYLIFFFFKLPPLTILYCRFRPTSFLLVGLSCQSYCSCALFLYPTCNGPPGLVHIISAAHRL